MARTSKALVTIRTMRSAIEMAEAYVTMQGVSRLDHRGSGSVAACQIADAQGGVTGRWALVTRLDDVNIALFYSLCIEAGLGPLYYVPDLKLAIAAFESERKSNPHLPTVSVTIRSAGRGISVSNKGKALTVVVKKD